MKADSVLSVILSVALLSSSLLVYVELASADATIENTWEIMGLMPEGITVGGSGSIQILCE